MLIHYYRRPGLTVESVQSLMRKVARSSASEVRDIQTEYCYNILATEDLKKPDRLLLAWLLGETYSPQGLSGTSLLETDGTTLEVGPRMNFTTAWSTNATAICQACGLHQIVRIERSRRFLVRPGLGDPQRQAFLELIHDRMTECPYPEPLASFESGITPEPVAEIPLIQEGRQALEK